MKTILYVVAVILYLAIANVAWAYTSDCYASASHQNDSDQYFAEVNLGDTYSKARAGSWDIGTIVVQEADGPVGNSMASSHYEQEFEVIEAGDAFIDMWYGGNLAYEVEDVYGSYEVGYDIEIRLWHYSSAEYASASNSIDNDQDGSFSQSFSDHLVVADRFYVWDLGDILRLDVSLSTFCDSPISASYFYGAADFYNSLSIDSYSATLKPINTPIPIPGAVWLLGSGFLGIVGLRRKFRR